MGCLLCALVFHNRLLAVFFASYWSVSSSMLCVGDVGWCCSWAGKGRMDLFCTQRLLAARAPPQQSPPTTSMTPPAHHGNGHHKCCDKAGHPHKCMVPAVAHAHPAYCPHLDAPLQSARVLERVHCTQHAAAHQVRGVVGHQVGLEHNVRQQLRCQALQPGPLPAVEPCVPSNCGNPIVVCADWQGATS